MDLGDLTFELAKPLEGTAFELETADGRTIPMKLEEVLPYETRPQRRSRGGPQPKRQAFALYFLGSSPDPLEQGTYTLRSEKTTFQSLFIVPVARVDEGIEYEAVIA